MAKLTAVKVRSAEPGRYQDGDGLQLVVKKNGSRFWVLRIQQDGRRRDIGLGSVDLESRQPRDFRPSDDLPILLKRHLTLSEARVKARELRQFSKAGKDPVVERDRDRSAAPTFEVAMRSAHEGLKAGWEEQTAVNFLKSLEVYACPKIGMLRVDAVDASHVRQVLEPIWTTKPDLARKVRVRVGQVLNFSQSKGWRSTEAPGRAVAIGLPKQPNGGHFKAMPYSEVPAFVATLRTAAPTMGRRALLFMILTVVRPGEVRFARWDQIDIPNANWTRSAEEMKKSKAAHMVTLSPQALALLEVLKSETSARSDGLIFTNRNGKALSDAVMTKLMRDAGVLYDAHGFRSSFRDWAAEAMPAIPDPVAEAALAHAVLDQTVRAYKRTTFIKMRRELLGAWGLFVTGAS